MACTGGCATPVFSCVPESANSLWCLCFMHQNAALATLTQSDKHSVCGCNEDYLIRLAMQTSQSLYSIVELA